MFCEGETDILNIWIKIIWR